MAALLGTLAGSGLTAQQPGQPEPLYREGRYFEAYEAFRALADERGASPVLEYDSGNALFRLRRFVEAIRSFRQALQGPPELRQRAYYNLGVTYLAAAYSFTDRQAALRQALEAFQAALLLDPGDADAKWNLELALRRMNERESAAEQEEERPAQVWRGGNLTKAGYAGAGTGGTSSGGEQPRPTPPQRQRLTTAQAQQLLQAVQRGQRARQAAGASSPTLASPGLPDW